MGRKADPKCVYCATNYRTEDIAKTKHPDCYTGRNCQVKRNRLRNRDRINAQRRDNAAKKKGIETIEPIKPNECLLGRIYRLWSSRSHSSCHRTKNLRR